MIHGKLTFSFPSFYLILDPVLSRFKGELYGVGSNHTKYKTKYPAGTAPNGNGGGNNGFVNGGVTVNQHPQLQFSSAVHYPASLQMNFTQSPAPATFGYEEGY